MNKFFNLFVILTLTVLTVCTLDVTPSRAASFTAGNIVVYQVGDGAAALSSAGTAVFLDEYTPAGMFVQSIAVPTTASGANRRLVASGTATTEGLMTCSTDGQYLVLSGYDAALGTASLTTSASTVVNRVIGRVDWLGNIDTTTALTDASSASSPRGVASTNGTDLWLSGGAGSVRYTTLGATTSTQLSTTVTNMRGVAIYGGQLYISTQSGTTVRVGTVGTGLPTTSGQTITNLPGFSTTSNPNAFFLADLSAGVTGVDTLYVADETAGMILKYSLVAGTWTSDGTITATSVRGLTGTVSGLTVTLYLTYSNGTKLATVVDTAGYNAAPSATAVTDIASAGTNRAFRGVALAPQSNLPNLTINDVSLNEGNSGTTSFTFTVSLSEPAGAGGVTFDIATADGTATAPSDYTDKSLTGQTIPNGSSTYSFTVSVNGDTTPESNETFFVNVTNVTGAGVTDSQGQGTIVNDDFTVTYNGNGNTGGSVPNDSNSYITGATVTVLGNTGALVNTGYTFTGWNTAANGSGTAYSPTDTFSMGSSNVTLYAIWRNLTDFIITVKTDNPGTSTGTQFMIPTTGAGYNYNVDCDNDGTNEAYAQTGNYTCNFGAAGTYTIRIQDNSGAYIGFPRIYFNNGGDAKKLLTIQQWSIGKWISMSGAFAGCSNMTMTATDAPDLSGVTDLSSMFYNASAFNGNIGSWNTASVTNMSYMFYGASTFNQNIGSWNVGAVTDATNMFYGVALSTTNYDALLQGWNAQTLQSSVTFDGGNSTYCAGEAARSNIISASGWSITDGGKTCHIVTYSGNGNDGGTAPIDPSSPYLAGSTVTVLGNTGGLLRNGGSFTGWNTAADGSGTAYSPGNTFTMGSSNVTLYAQWLSFKVTSIIIDPAMPIRLYAGTDGGGVYKSTDSGLIWTATTQPANHWVKGLVMKPALSSTLYAATYGGGIFRSTDSGDSWTDCNTGLGNLNATSLAIDPSGILYAGTEAGIYTSGNCDTWSGLNTGLLIDASKPPVSIALDPTTPTTIYAGLDGGGIYKKTAMTDWTATNITPADARVRAVVIKPGDSTKLYAATYGNGVFYSTNSGVDWSVCANTNLTNLNVISLTIDSSGKLYAGTESGVFVSSDGLCATWSPMSAGLP